ncbi:MAG: hypothetical protein HGA37_10055, partial [Lentimicrobium sp.]|nr:hypothetical protein [Lentimicrobium sp.]
MKTLFLNFLLLTFCLGQLSYGQIPIPNNTPGRPVQKQYPAIKLPQHKLPADMGNAVKSKANLEPDWSQKSIIPSDNNFATVKFGGLERDSQGNYVYVALNGNEESTYKGVLVKTQNNGTEIWRQDYIEGFYTAASRVAIDNQDNIFVLGEVIRDSINREMYLRKYTSAGDVLWTKFYSHDYFALPKGVNLFIDSDQNIIAVSVINAGENTLEKSDHVQKFDQDGNTLWQHVFLKQSSSSEDYSLLMPDNSIVLIQDTYFAIKIGSDGEVQWTYTSDGSIMAATGTSTGEIALLYRTGGYGDMTKYITKIGNDGNEIWSQMMESSICFFAGSICENNNGDIFAITRSSEDGPKLSKLNSQGVIEYNKVSLSGESDFDNYGYYYFLHLNDEGKIIVGGMSENFTLIAATFDENGNILAVNSMNDFETGYQYIYAYDGFSYHDGKLISGANQRMYYYNGVVETGYDLFVTAIDINAEPVWTQFTYKEVYPGTLVSATVLDDENNTYYTANNAMTFSVTKLGDSGELLWSNRYFEDYEGGASDLLISGNSIIICGSVTISGTYIYKPAIISLNADGSINWQHIIDNPELNTASAYYMKEDSDGNLLVAADGYINYVPVVCIFKLSPTGEELWSYYNSAVTPTYVYDLQVDNQNNIIYSGVLGFFGNGATVYAEKLNAEGAQIWGFSNAYGENSLFSQAYCDNSNNTYLVGQNENNGILVKLDPSGEVEWEIIPSDPGYYYGITGNVEKSSVYVAGSKYEPEEIWLTELTAYNTDGTALWTDNIGDISRASYGKYVIADENNLYFSGFSMDGDANQYSL